MTSKAFSNETDMAQEKRDALDRFYRRFHGAPLSEEQKAYVRNPYSKNSEAQIDARQVREAGERAFRLDGEAMLEAMRRPMAKE